MDNFAQELIDEILDHAASDPGKSVRALGLVCKQWWLRTRLHVFSYVVIRPARAQSFFNLVETSPAPILTFIETLDLHFDQSSLPFLDKAQLLQFRQSSKCKKLRIQLPDLSGSDGIAPGFYPSVELHASILGTAIPSLLSLSIHFESILLGVAVAVISSFPSLGYASLYGNEISTGVVPPGL